MLRNVLRKDLVLNAPQLWGLLLWFGYAAYMLFREPDSLRLAAGGSALVGALIASTISAREAKLRVAATLASLPVRRRTLVQGSYAVALIVGAAMFAVVAAAAFAVPAAARYAGAAFQANTVLVSLGIAAIVVAVLMPVLVRFGLVGMLVFLVSFQVLGAVLFILLRLFGVRAAHQVFAGLEGAIQSWHAALARPLPVITSVLVLTLCTWLSFRLSVYLAERQDL